MIGGGNLEGIPVPLSSQKQFLPKPLGPDDLDYLIELLRNDGDCDARADFAVHVKAIMAAYARFYRNS